MSARTLQSQLRLVRCNNASQVKMIGRLRVNWARQITLQNRSYAWEYGPGECHCEFVNIDLELPFWVKVFIARLLFSLSRPSSTRLKYII